MFCKNCGNEMNENQAICLKCGMQTGKGNAFCYNCGKPITKEAAVCLNCGIALNSTKQKSINGDFLCGKDKTTLAFLCFLFGGFGIHNFMLGETKKGIVKIACTLIFGLGYILGYIDLYKILTEKYEVDPENFI